MILEKLENLNDDQKLYVEMSVRDVKMCFGENLVKFPANTFKQLPKMLRTANGEI